MGQRGSVALPKLNDGRAELPLRPNFPAKLCFGSPPSILGGRRFHRRQPHGANPEVDLARMTSPGRREEEKHQPPVLAEHIFHHPRAPHQPQMLAHAVKVATQGRRHGRGRARRPVRQQLDDGPADRVAQRREHRHRIGLI